MTTWQKIVVFFIAIFIGGTVIYVCIRENMKDNNTPVIQTNTQSNEVDSVFNQYVEKKENTDNDSNNEVQNVIPDEKEEGTPLKDEASKKVEVTGTDEEKAIALSKNTWGADDDSISFNVARKEGDIFYVSVNDNKTTRVLTWYKVNVKTGEVSDY